MLVSSCACVGDLFRLDSWQPDTSSKIFSFWWITITGTAVRILFLMYSTSKRLQVLWFPEPNGEQARRVFPLVLSVCTCALRNFACIPTSGLHLGMKVWTLTSKGKSETEAHRDEFTTDRASSEHLALTLFWSSVSLFPVGHSQWRRRAGVWVWYCGSMAATWPKSWHHFFCKCLKYIFKQQSPGCSFNKQDASDDSEHLEIRVSVQWESIYLRHQQLMETAIN